MSMLQVKIKFSLKLFNLCWFLTFVLAKSETKETENQPRLKNFNQNLILTSNIILLPLVILERLICHTY